MKQPVPCSSRRCASKYLARLYFDDQLTFDQLKVRSKWRVKHSRCVSFLNYNILVLLIPAKLLGKESCKTFRYVRYTLDWARLMLCTSTKTKMVLVDPMEAHEL